MPQRLLLDGASAEDLLTRVHTELGPGARILEARKVRVGGFAGFFSKERYEMCVEVDDAAPDPSAGIGPAVGTPVGPAAAGAAALPVDGNDGAPIGPAETLFELIQRVEGREAADVLEAAAAAAAAAPAAPPAPRAIASPARSAGEPAQAPAPPANGFTALMAKYTAIPATTAADPAAVPAVPALPFALPAATPAQLSAAAPPAEPPPQPPSSQPAAVQPAVAPAVRRVTDLAVIPPAVPAAPAVPVGPAMPVVPAGQAAALVRIGVPLAMLAGVLPVDDPVGIVVARLPQPPKPPAEAGAILAVVGEERVAYEHAVAVAKLIRTDPARILAVTPQPGTAGVAARNRLSGPAQAAERARKLRGLETPSIVVVDAPLDPDAAYWVASVLRALKADAVWAVVDATRKTADIADWLGRIGPVEALALHNSGATRDPAAVLGLGLPVMTIDGRRATRAAWGALIRDRLDVEGEA